MFLTLRSGKYSGEVVLRLWRNYSELIRGSDGCAPVFQFADPAVVGVKINEPAADDSGDGSAVHRASVKRCVSALRLGTVNVEDPFELRIENRNVGVSVGFQ